MKGELETNSTLEDRKRKLRQKTYIQKDITAI